MVSYFKYWKLITFLRLGVGSNVNYFKLRPPSDDGPCILPLPLQSLAKTKQFKLLFSHYFVKVKIVPYNFWADIKSFASDREHMNVP